jgi:hypothetical protein
MKGRTVSVNIVPVDFDHYFGFQSRHAFVQQSMIVQNWKISSHYYICLQESEIFECHVYQHATIGCGEQDFRSAQPYLSLLLNAANFRCALSSKMGTIFFLG